MLIYFDLFSLNLLNNYLENIFCKNYILGYYVTFDYFGLVLLGIGYIVGFCSLIAMDNKFFWYNFKYIYYFNIFLLIIHLYTTVTNIFFFFFLYELLLIPSFIIVYKSSTSRKAIQASYYFLIWTQVGSFLVLISIIYILTVAPNFEFNQYNNYKFSINESYILYTLFFIGFGIKIPIWPAHYWITKTHVEAPSGFSMFLSGFLVKTALFGFYKFTSSLQIEINTTIFIIVILLGVIDSSLKMWGQIDIKKLIAYCTIQEMNLIFLAFILGDSNIIFGGVLFIITHALLSTIMFYTVDCIYRRYKSRLIIELSGIIHKTPLLGLSSIFMCIIYMGLPGTLKFVSEVILFSSLFELSSFIVLILLIFSNVIGLIGFIKCWYTIIFGMNINLFIVDLNKKEIYLKFICYFLLVFLTYFVPLY